MYHHSFGGEFVFGSAFQKVDIERNLNEKMVMGGDIAMRHTSANKNSFIIMKRAPRTHFCTTIRSVANLFSDRTAEIPLYRSVLFRFQVYVPDEARKTTSSVFLS